MKKIVVAIATATLVAGVNVMACGGMAKVDAASLSMGSVGGATTGTQANSLDALNQATCIL